jgi:hypothetical protein
LKNKTLIYTLIGLLSAAILFILFYSYSPEEKKKDNKVKIERKENDWFQKFGHRNLHPYGTFIFYQLMRDRYKNRVRTIKRNSQYKSLDTIINNRKLYVFVGKKFDTHYKRLNKILDFVKRGNAAFIAADIFPEQIKYLLADDYKVHRSYYRNIESNFKDSLLRTEKNYNFRFIFKGKNIYRYWTDFEHASNYYETFEHDESAIRVFESNSVSDNPVFIALALGKGKLYLHSTPYAFTNTVMKLERGFDHAQRVVSCLPDEPIVFDGFLNGPNDGAQNNSDGKDGQAHLRSSPLEFILENQSLRWAYYVLLIGLLIYILTKGKRKQKIIPPKAEIENTSVEFADTMSKLYLQYGQHKYIVFQQEKNFLNYIRNKYYIKSVKVDDDYIDKLTVKSGIEKEKINHIFERFSKIKTLNHATTNDVVEIYAEIEYFYKNCK